MKAILVEPKQVVQQHHEKDKQVQQQVERQKPIAKKRITKQMRYQQKTFKDVIGKGSEKTEHSTIDKKNHLNKKGTHEAAKQSLEVENLLDDLTNAKNVSTFSKPNKVNKTSHSNVDNLLDDLINAKNMPTFSKPNKVNKTSHSDVDINAYKTMVSQAISKKFYDTGRFSGKTCDLHINLASDGMLISITTSKGDPELCQAAVLAAKLARLPKPPTMQVYERVKTATIVFSPQ
ncbi:TolA protein, transmembrane link with the outer membrane lipoprotein, Pal [Candidatus Palibaumannia cicadellinicola]|uniref:TolA protein, transmembrane link with the outer membrane lipoprotein, Pal n=2 Tax=Candidatus Palibaumannia cicadellinicola TaxID=186490 RepID=A0A088MXR9_9GAMM|nr:TolA protein, transmembrane link with the outer membrane lipoprotein, Pal [Candidatus Baumannia cicadellinicola]